MRKFQILLFGLAVSQIAPAHAQDPAGELMLEAYQQSIANANDFDAWVSRNASRFDAKIPVVLKQQDKQFNSLCTKVGSTLSAAPFIPRSGKLPLTKSM